MPTSSRTLIALVAAAAVPGTAIAGDLADQPGLGTVSSGMPPGQGAGASDPRADSPVAVNRRAVPRQFGTARAARTPQAASQTAGPASRIVLEADTLTQEADTNTIVASGSVVAREGGRTLRADQISYDRTTGVAVASGSVTLVEADGAVSTADRLTLDDQAVTGVIQGLAIRLPEDAILAANTAVRREGQRVVLSQMVYTACKICEDGSRPPTWTIRARQALQSEPEKTITYNDMVFEVAGQPVLWLPWFRHPDPSAERQSGFLQPTPGRSGRYGYNISLPYQFVLDEHSDFTVTPTIYQFINPLLELDYRRAFHSGDLRLTGTGTYESFFRRLGRNIGEKDWRGSLFGQGLFAINDIWRWGFGLETASDDTYLLRYDLDGLGGQRGDTRAQPNRLMSQLYLIGQTDHLFARVLGVNFQDLNGPILRKEPPIVLPMLELTRAIAIGPMNGRADVFGSAVRLDRREGQRDTARVSAGMRWRGHQVIGPGIVVEPSVFARSDWFSYDNASLAAGSNVSLRRTVGNASLDVRWPLERVDRRLTWQIEPRLLVSVATKDANQRSVFNEDSPGFEFDSSAQFRPNAAAGYDFWDGGASVTAGITLGAQVGTHSVVRWFVGSRLRQDPTPGADRVSNLGRKRGDIVSDLDVTWGNTLQLSARARFDSETGEPVRAELGAYLNAGPLTLSTRYHRLWEDYAPANRANHEVYAVGEWRLSPSWSIIAGGTRDLMSRRNLRELVGISWKDDCTEVRLISDRMRFVNRFIEPTNNIRLEIAFRTLGALNPDPLD